MKKSCVYIDGFNLYYGLRTMRRAGYFWLDLERLARSFIGVEAETPARVKYFTARVRGNPGSEGRQKTYLNALTANCPNLEIHYGRFLAKQRQCRKCGSGYDLYEEKKTDVNIACHLLADAFADRYDRIYIVSGDSDLVPAVEMMKQMTSRPRIIVANPPKRKSEELCRAADASFSIKEKSLRLSQLPETVISRAGAKLSRPDKWTAASGKDG